MHSRAWHLKGEHGCQRLRGQSEAKQSRPEQSRAKRRNNSRQSISLSSEVQWASFFKVSTLRRSISGCQSGASSFSAPLFLNHQQQKPKNYEVGDSLVIDGASNGAIWCRGFLGQGFGDRRAGRARNLKPASQWSEWVSGDRCLICEWSVDMVLGMEEVTKTAWGCGGYMRTEVWGISGQGFGDRRWKSSESEASDGGFVYECPVGMVLG